MPEALQFDAAAAARVEEVTPVEPVKVPEVAAPTLFDAFKETLSGGGVKAVTAHDLYPTPVHIAELMVAYADIRPGDRVLEPSAGTGAVVGAMGGKMFGHDPERGWVHAVEINSDLCAHLRKNYPLTHVHHSDFLQWRPEAVHQFDRVLMNPPFSGGADIKHIEHAFAMLKPGGVLVAICANGPRQRAAFMDRAEHWEDLPDGTFKSAGTMVRSALFTLRK